MTVGDKTLVRLSNHQNSHTAHHHETDTHERIQLSSDLVPPLGG